MSIHSDCDLNSVSSSTDRIVRYLCNWSVSLLEGNWTSDLREFFQFRDFSEHRSVLLRLAICRNSTSTPCRNRWHAQSHWMNLFNDKQGDRGFTDWQMEDARIFFLFRGWSDASGWPTRTFSRADCTGAVWEPIMARFESQWCPGLICTYLSHMHFPFSFFFAFQAKKLKVHL